MRHSVRTKSQRRTQAVAQAREYTFENSKAARNGVDQEKWQEQHNARVKHMESIRD